MDGAGRPDKQQLDNQMQAHETSGSAAARLRRPHRDASTLRNLRGRRITRWRRR